MSFSILMSLYDKENPRFLDACLLSIKEQTLPADEVVLVFDGPINSQLQEVVEKWRPSLPFKIVALPKNVGLGQALSIGLDNCSHDLVLRMDTDDICMKDRFEVQVKVMNENPEVSLIGSCIEEISPLSEESLGERRVPSDPAAIRKWSKFRNPFNHMTVAYRKNVVVAAGGYQHFLFMEDYALWLRMIAMGANCRNVEKCLVRARTGEGMLQRRRGKSYFKSEFQLFKLKKSLKITGWFDGFFIFMARALTRALPSSLLAQVYRVIRKSLM